VSATKKTRKRKAKPVSGAAVRRDATIIRDTADQIVDCNKNVGEFNGASPDERFAQIASWAQTIHQKADDLDARTGRRERVLEGTAQRPSQQ
jgi:PAS domain-containing protein